MNEPISILIVDDTPNDIRRIENQLNELGDLEFLMLKAGSTNEARAKIQAHTETGRRVHIALVDAHLSNSDDAHIGLSFADELKRDGIPVIVITQAAGERVREAKLPLWDKGDQPAVLNRLIREEVVLNRSRRAFIVYSVDQERKTVRKVNKALKEVGLEPVILRKEARGHAEIGAELLRVIRTCELLVVVMTADDRAIRSGELATALQENLPELFEHRARQNVIYEWGLASALFREDRVFLLHDSSITLPSDNIARWRIDITRKGWKAELHTLLRASGAVSLP